VRARTYTINGFSAHADQQQLLAWHEQTGAARTFLVHGEETAMRTFAACLGKAQVEMPELNQVYEI
jgi:metallo-beta-lactamase family protein